MANTLNLGITEGTFNATTLVELTLPDGFTVGDVCLVANRLKNKGQAAQTAWIIYRTASAAIKEGGIDVANTSATTLSIPEINVNAFTKATLKQSRRSVDFCDDGPTWLWNLYYNSPAR